MNRIHIVGIGTFCWLWGLTGCYRWEPIAVAGLPTLAEMPKAVRIDSPRQSFELDSPSIQTIPPLLYATSKAPGLPPAPLDAGPLWAASPRWNAGEGAIYLLGIPRTRVFLEPGMVPMGEGLLVPITQRWNEVKILRARPGWIVGGAAGVLGVTLAVIVVAFTTMIGAGLIPLGGG